MKYTAETAAVRLGMAVGEIIAVDQVQEGTVVTTHDGNKTLIDTDGGLYWYGEKAPNGGLPLFRPSSGEVEQPQPKTAAKK